MSHNGTVQGAGFFFGHFVKPARRHPPSLYQRPPKPLLPRPADKKRRPKRQAAQKALGGQRTRPAGPLAAISGPESRVAHTGAAPRCTHPARPDSAPHSLARNKSGPRPNHRRAHERRRTLRDAAAMHRALSRRLGRHHRGPTRVDHETAEGVAGCNAWLEYKQTHGRRNSNNNKLISSHGSMELARTSSGLVFLSSGKESPSSIPACWRVELSVTFPARRYANDVAFAVTA